MEVYERHQMDHISDFKIFFSMYFIFLPVNILWIFDVQHPK